MSSTRSRLLALAILTAAVAGSGIVALGAVCDFDPACGEPVDSRYELSQAEGQGFLSYGLAVEEGTVVAESVDWTTAPPSQGGGGDADGKAFVLAVDKNEIPLDPGIRYTLENGTGSVTWDSGSADTGTQAGDTFTFTLYAETRAEDVVLHRTQVTITR